MNISELFKKIQDEFDVDEIKGEYILQGNVIIWSYNLSDDDDEFEYVVEDNEEFIFNYECECDEELLIEAYHEDVENLKLFLDGINELENWNISEYEVVDDVILFKLF